MTNLEFEFKTLIDKNLYEKLLNSLNPTESFSQENIYFDDEEETLHKNKMAMRVRIKESCKKITIKHRFERYILEVSDYLDDNDCQNLLTEKTIKSNIILDYLNDHNVNKTFFNKCVKFITHRRMFEYDNHTLFLDKTIFADGSEDYEIEVESHNIEDCETIFNGYLAIYGIEDVVSKVKIQRAKEKAIN